MKRPTEKPLQVCRPFAEAFEFLGQRWTARLLHTLAQRPARFTELRQATTGISDRLLSLRLDDLSNRRLVDRHRGADGPVRYALTDDGQDLAGFLEDICTWAQEHDLGDQRPHPSTEPEGG